MKPETQKQKQTENTAGETLRKGENHRQYLSDVLIRRSGNVRFLFMYVLQYTCASLRAYLKKYMFIYDPGHCFNLYPTSLSLLLC